MPEHDSQRPTDSAWNSLGEAFTALVRGLGRLFTDPNQPRLALRTRNGSTPFRLPVAIAALVGVLLVWKALLLLVVIVIAVFATGSRFVLINPTSHQP